MPVSVVVGGQYGSEGKGKVAYWLARKQKAKFAIRVGGPNSGHTVVADGRRIVLRQLPTASLLDDVVSVVPAGAYLNVDLLLNEIAHLRLKKSDVLIHPCAVIIKDSMRKAEIDGGLVESIASTGQGVGIAVLQRVSRQSSVTFAGDIEALQDYVSPNLDSILDSSLRKGQRVLVEGTQGFGLSILHGGDYPFATSRDTTAAGALSEAGLSPMDVDCVALTLRSFPIRVGGNSGPLPLETSWQIIGVRARSQVDLTEYATVTQRPRRVAEFHIGVVKRAIRINRPNIIVLNHADYFDYSIHERQRITQQVLQALVEIESGIGTSLDYVGSGPSQLISRPSDGWVPERSDLADCTCHNKINDGVAAHDER